MSRGLPGIITIFINSIRSLQIRKFGNGYDVLFPKQILEDMRSTEDTILNVEKVDGVYQIFPYDSDSRRR